MRSEKPAIDTNVQAVFDRHPPVLRDKLLALRAAILDVAAEENLGPIEETLKWGQPSYLTANGSGTTIRIDRDDTHGGAIALYVNCKSSLVGEWRDRFPEMIFGGDRSLHLTLDAGLDDPRLRICIADALTYHRRKKAAKRG
ncbi:MAG: hypothetical protein JWM58_3339 [Rhizobium sp.]|nr:hypothetical protein [Rhizobium sp.]